MPPRLRTALSLVVLALAPLAASACSSFQEKTTGQAFDEAAAGTGVKTKLFAVGGFERFGEVDVEVADRLILLSGRVPSEQDKADAERIAWSVGKIDQVANELVVAPRDLERDARDRLITERVRARLIANKDIRGLNYNIQVFDGSVFLLGYAESPDELRRAAEATAQLGGVKRVVSYVKVRGEGARPAVFPGQQPAAAGSADVAPTVQADGSFAGQAGAGSSGQPVLLGPARDPSAPFATADSPPDSGIEGTSLPPAQ